MHTKLSTLSVRSAWQQAKQGLTKAIALASLACVAAPAYAACSLSNFNARLQSTGTGPFNTADVCVAGGTAHTAGNDACSTDNVVRTNDTYVYRFNFKVPTGAKEDNITFTSTLPLVAGRKVAIWDNLPPQCTGAGSSVSVDGLTLVCNVGNVDRTASGDLSSALLAQVKTTVNGANADQITGVSTNVSTDQCTAADNAPEVAPAVEISARQKADFRKDYPYGGGQTAHFYGGQAGYLVSWYVYVDQFDPAGASAKGGQALLSPVILKDRPTSFPAGSIWFDCGRAEGQQGNISCPAQGTSVTNGAASDLTITAQAGEAAEFLVAGGLNTNVQTDPNTANPARLATYYLRYWVPLSAINAAGGQINLRNDIPAAEIVGTDRSGLPIVDTQPANNGLAITVTGNPGGWYYKYVAREWSYSPWAGAVAGTAAAGEIQMQGTNNYGDSGTGLVFPSQIFYPMLRYQNPSVLPATDVVLCDSFNATETRVADIPGFPGHGAAWRYASPGQHGVAASPFSSGYTVEYGVAPGTPSAATSRCDNGDATWYPTLTAAAAAGARELINKVRFTIPVLDSGGYTEMVIAHQARPNVNGTIIEDYASFKGSTIGSPLGSWVLSSYDEATNNGVGSGKRFTLTTSLARVAKEASLTETGAAINQAAAGGTVFYKLTPALSSVVTGLPPTYVTIVDRLPQPLVYVAGSAKLGAIALAPDSIVPGPTETVITWTINNLTPNVVIPTLSFRAQVPQTVPPNSTLVNSVAISSPDDVSDISQRTATKALTILNPPGLYVFKSVTAPLIDPNGFVRWKAQISNFDIAATTVDVIDVLPYVGDARAPSSSFLGTRGLASAITPPGGGTVRYSSKASATVVFDPDAPGNTSMSVNGWCLVSEFGTAGCPASFAQVTAFRLTGASIASNATIDINFDMPTDANAVGNVYSNRFYAKSSDPSLSTLRSNDVSATVALGSISGKVYYDSDRTATQNGAADTPIPGITLTLCKVAPVGGACPAGQTVLDALSGTPLVTTTAPDGSYRFGNVATSPAGGYFIVETVPAGFGTGPVNAAGSLGGTGTTNLFSNVVVPTGANGTNYNFGHVLPDLNTTVTLPIAPVAPGSTVVGSVVLGNSSQTPGQNSQATLTLTPGLTGVVVTLPAGWAFAAGSPPGGYDPATGLVRLVPTAVGGVFPANSQVTVGVQFTAPENGPVSLRSDIRNSLVDLTSINNPTAMTDPSTTDPTRNAHIATVAVLQMSLDVRKRAGTPRPLTNSERTTLGIAGSDGAFMIPYRVIVSNKGPITATNVQLTDRLDFTYVSPAIISGVFQANSGFSGARGAALVAGSHPNCAISPAAFNGVSQPNMLSGSFNLPALPNAADPNTAASCIVEFTVVVNYAANPVPVISLKNTAYGSANNNPNNPGPTAFTAAGVPTFGAPGQRASDASTDTPQAPPQPYPGGAYPGAPTPGSTPANTDTPDPTPVILGDPQQIDVRKSSSLPVQLDVSGRRFRIAYTVNVSNTSATATASNVQLSENLRFTFAAPATFIVSNLTSVSGSCPVNTAFDGGLTNTAAGYNMIGTNGISSVSLAPNQSCVMSFVVDLTWPAGGVPTAAPQNRIFGSTAFGNNSGPIFDAGGAKTADAPNMITKDTSANVDAIVPTYGATAPADPGRPATANSDVGSSTLAKIKTLEVVKSVVGTVTTLGPKKFRVPFTIRVTAVGVAGEVLPNVQAIDNLNQTFNRAGLATTTITVQNHQAPVASPAGSYCPASFTNFNGRSAQQLFAGNTSLTVGQSCEFRFDVEVDYTTGSVDVGPHQNTVYASSVPSGTNTGGTVAISPSSTGPNGTNGTVAGVWTPPSGAIAIDASTDGTRVPVTAAADTPLPTPVVFSLAAPLSAIKYVENVSIPGAPVVSGADVQWTIVYKNEGSFALTDVQVTDTLHASLINGKVISAVKTPTTALDTLAISTTYDGTAAKNATLQAPTRLEAGQFITIKIQATVKPDYVGAVTNQANLSALEYGGPSGKLIPTSAVNPTAPACPNTNACIPAGVTVPVKALVSQPTDNATKDQANVLTVVKGGSIAGVAWFDGNRDGTIGGDERRVPGLRVGVFAIDPVTGDRLAEITKTADRPITDANGAYNVGSLPPSTNGGPQYEVVFYNEAGDAVLGAPSPMAFGNANNGQLPATPAKDRIVKIKVSSGEITPSQNLPLDPGGVVYDAVTRLPVPGALVTFTGPAGFNPATQLQGGASNATQTTGVSGVYQFVLLPGAPAGQYTINVVPPSDYTFRSSLIPAQASGLTPPTGAGQRYAVQSQATPPQISSNDPTTYFLSFSLTVGSSQEVVHNHIPLDPRAKPRISLAKSVSKPVAEIGDLVTYTLRVRNIGNAALNNVVISDRLPRGFRYIPGTTQVSGTIGPSGTGVALQSVADPAGSPGPNMQFSVPGTIAINTEALVYYKVRLGVGSLQSDGVNRATARSGAITSNEARAKVRVEAGVFTADACVLGKVFVDCNNNHIQDAEELGIPGVRMYLSDGTNFTTDSEGKYSYCGLSPKSHVLRIDMLTMPRGSRLTTTSNRNLGDAGSMFLDVTNGTQMRADFAEGSCSNTVLEQVKSRRAQGEVRSVETEKKGQPAKKFEGKAPNYPQQGTDGANQRVVIPRPPTGGAVSESEQDTPVPSLPAASSNTRGSSNREPK